MTAAESEVERLREALKRIGQGFDAVNGAAARVVDGYYRGLAKAALGEAER